MNGFDATRPAVSEYDPYYGPMIGLVPDEPVLQVLEEQRHEIMGFLGSLDKATADYRYGPDKWSVKEVLGHGYIPPSRAQLLLEDVDFTNAQTGDADHAEHRPLVHDLRA